MKFVVSSGVLQKQLSLINGVIINNPVVPILENFLFLIDNGTLTAVASDLQITMTTSLTVETTESAKIAVPAKILLETLKTLPDQPITVNIDEEAQNIEITSYKGRYKLTGERADDFPKVPEPSGSLKVEMPAQALAEAINNTLFAVSGDELRPAMTGVYVQLSKDDTTFVATDGNRLVRYKRHDIKADSNTAVILPKKAMNLLKSALPTDATPVTTQFSQAHAFFNFQNVRLSCRLIDENYPDYENAIPKNNDKTLEANRAELLNSLKRLDIYANKTTHQIRLKMNGELLQIFAEDLDFANEAQEGLTCEYEGEELEIGFNARYLIEILGNLNTDEALLTFSQPSRACIVLPKDQSAEEEMLMLIMPVMLNTYA